MFKRDPIERIPLYAELLNYFIKLLPNMKAGRRIQRADVRAACSEVYNSKVTKEKMERLRNTFKSRHAETIADIEKLIKLKAERKIVLRSNRGGRVGEAEGGGVGEGGGDGVGERKILEEVGGERVGGVRGGVVGGDSPTHFTSASPTHSPLTSSSSISFRQPCPPATIEEVGGDDGVGARGQVEVEVLLRDWEGEEDVGGECVRRGVVVGGGDSPTQSPMHSPPTSSSSISFRQPCPPATIEDLGGDDGVAERGGGSRSGGIVKKRGW